MRKNTFLLLLSMMAMLIGCGAKNEKQPFMVAETEAITETAQNTTKDGGSSMSKGLMLIIDDTVIPVIWEDNPSVAELTEHAARKAMQIEMSMYGSWEQVGSLGSSISRNDVQMTASSGDIMLYSGNQIVLFYGENTWAYTKLGHMDLPKNEITALLSDGAVSITLAVQ